MAESIYSEIKELDKYLKSPSNLPVLEVVKENDNFTELNKRFPDLYILGMGKESLAIIDPDDPGKVLTFGWDIKSPRPGIMPSSEIYNIQNALAIIYPNTFPKVTKMEGFGLRNTKREMVQGEMETDVDSAVMSAAEINSNLESIGINFYLDPWRQNFIKTPEGNLKYVDLVDGSAKNFINFLPNKARLMIDKSYPNLSEQERDRKWKDLMIYVRRLSELEVVNKLVLAYSNDQTIEISAMQDEIDKFTFLNQPSEVEKDIRSRYRMKLLMNKAIDAIKSGKYRYSKNGWSEVTKYGGTNPL